MTAYVLNSHGELQALNEFLAEHRQEHKQERSPVKRSAVSILATHVRMMLARDEWVEINDDRLFLAGLYDGRPGVVL